jgi:hypothetical protein
MVLSNHSMVFGSSPRHIVALPSFLPTSKKLIWSSDRDKYECILALHILLSQTMDPRRKMSYNQIKMCMCVKH